MIIVIKSIDLEYGYLHRLDENFKLKISKLIVNNNRTLAGTFCTYYLLITMMTVALVIAPQTASYMPHSGQNSSGMYARTFFRQTFYVQ